MSPRDHYLDDRASRHGPFDPWADDQTTTTYESKHLRSMRQGQPLRRASVSEPAFMGDFALPEILEEEYLAPQYPVRSATRNAAYSVQHVAPSHGNPRVHPQPQVVARPPLRAVPSLFDYDADEEENPFARRSSAGAWFLATAAAAGIFGAVLFGRVLLEASRAPSAVQASAPLAAAAEPEVRAAAPSPEAQSAPTVQALAPVAEVGAAARDSGARPAATSKKRSHTRRARHERRPRATSDDAGESPQRAKAQPRLSKNSSSAPALVEERDPPPANGIPALLRINSRPWSQIFVDGKLIGNTPQLAIQLVAGKHSVRLVNAEFGMTKTFTLKLAPGESVTRVETLQE